ncbi:hypothetical protein LCM08_11460 [Salipiger pacificus]|nr:hypothetical protein [Alloyangia pacifica]MCA0945527.1 hypothetical protein [Alloyangia pacifica]
MTPPRHPQTAVQATSAFASSRPGKSRRDHAGWVPLHHAARDILGNARALRGAITPAPSASRTGARRPE